MHVTGSAVVDLLRNAKLEAFQAWWKHTTKGRLSPDFAERERLLWGDYELATHTLRGELDARQRRAA
jgi:hypothetical protein